MLDFSNFAFTATTTVLRLIKTAPIAGVKTKPACTKPRRQGNGNNVVARSPDQVLPHFSEGGLAITLLLAQSTAFTTHFVPGKTYHIGEHSSLKLEGKTNVNGLTCRCTESFPTQTFYLEKLDDEKCTTVFRETSLKIKVKSLDCGNKMMNRDMYEALNAKAFPHIKIELVKVSENRCNRLDELKDWVQITAVAKITLNGKANEYSLNVAAQKTARNQFRFIGNKILCMSDFGVTPPVAAMGVVKVKDEIKISLDLEVIVE